MADPQVAQIALKGCHWMNRHASAGALGTLRSVNCMTLLLSVDDMGASGVTPDAKVLPVLQGRH